MGKKSKKLSETERIIKKWRKTAKNAMGCQKGLELDDRDCNTCEHLKYCMNYHEECIFQICHFIADMIEDSGNIVAKEMTDRIKKVSEEALFGKAEEEEKEDYNLYA